MNVSEALVSALRDWNCRYVFGVSGANIEHLHDAIHRLGGDNLQSVMAKSEIGAAMMADARARTHGSLGVCCSTSGGGMMNLAVGIAESYAESVPVLAIVGQPPQQLEGRGAFQDSSGVGRGVNAVQMWSAISKHVERIEEGANFWTQFETAVSAALSGRPGPVVLLVPRDVWEHEVPARPRQMQVEASAFATIPVPPADSVDELFNRIRRAKRPVLLMGTGVSRSLDGASVARFAKQAGVPVVSTMACTGIFPNNDPLYLGCVGVAGHPSAHDYLNDRADLIVAVGTGLDIMARGALSKAMMRAPLAVVNCEPDQIERTVQPSLVVRGDAGHVFAELSQRLRERPFYVGRPLGYVLTQYTTPLQNPEESTAVREENILLQSEALNLLQDRLPQNGHLIFDAGNCAASAIHRLQVPQGSSTNIALGMGGMGYAIPAAIGAQLGEDPFATTMVFCGDGAFLMQGLEVHTAVELGLRILFVVFNNNKHGMCLTRQKLLFEGREECVSYARLDADTMARGLGSEETLWTGRANTPEELQSLLAEYDNWKGGPGVLELKLPVEEMPPFAPFLPADAKTCAADWKINKTRTQQPRKISQTAA